jgi:hypothetical protein
MHRSVDAASRQPLTRRKAVAEPALGRAEWHVSLDYMSFFSTHAAARPMPQRQSPGRRLPARLPPGAASWRHDRIGSDSRPSA